MLNTALAGGQGGEGSRVAGGHGGGVRGGAVVGDAPGGNATDEETEISPTPNNIFLRASLVGRELRSSVSGEIRAGEKITGKEIKGFGKYQLIVLLAGQNHYLKRNYLAMPPRRKVGSWQLGEQKGKAYYGQIGGQKGGVKL